MTENSEGLGQEEHIRTHHPIVNGEEILPTPYLTLPFRRGDLVVVDSDFLSKHGLYDLTEGWIYSDGEQAIHGIRKHSAVDYHLPYGTPVAAPCDGFATSSYLSFPLMDDQGNPKVYKDSPITFGLGYFVRIYNPKLRRFVRMGHLSDITEQIPFSKPTLSNGKWTPTNFLPFDSLMDHPNVTKVKRGDIIGKVGFSGLRWVGCNEYQGEDRPVILPETSTSWDEPHVHLDEYFTDFESYTKNSQRDPYDLYGQVQVYPTPTKKLPIGREPLFYLDADGLPKYADSRIV